MSMLAIKGRCCVVLPSFFGYYSVLVLSVYFSLVVVARRSPAAVAACSSGGSSCANTCNGAPRTSPRDQVLVTGESIEPTRRFHSALFAEVVAVNRHVCNSHGVDIERANSRDTRSQIAAWIPATRLAATSPWKASSSFLPLTVWRSSCAMSRAARADDARREAGAIPAAESVFLPIVSFAILPFSPKCLF